MSNPQTTVKVAGHPLHPLLVTLPIGFFVATVGADIMYVQNSDPFWSRAAIWLLGAGVVTALVAALAGIIDFVGDVRIRKLAIAWLPTSGLPWPNSKAPFQEKMESMTSGGCGSTRAALVLESHSTTWPALPDTSAKATNTRLPC